MTDVRIKDDVTQETYTDTVDSMAVQVCTKCEYRLGGNNRMRKVFCRPGIRRVEHCHVCGAKMEVYWYIRLAANQAVIDANMFDTGGPVHRIIQATYQGVPTISAGKALELIRDCIAGREWETPMLDVPILTGREVDNGQ